MIDQYKAPTWDDFIGQKKLKDRLQIEIDGAMERYEPLPHILLCGPPGSGKTTIASVVAQKLAMPFEEFIMPLKPAALKKIVQMFNGVVLFDEIHRMSIKQQEELLPLIQSNYLQLDNGYKIHAACLTVIGATTEEDDVIKPLKDRFIRPMIDDYSLDEMARIVQRMGSIVGIDFPDDEAKKLGGAAAGVPRQVAHMVNMARNLHTTDADHILRKCRITEEGLTEHHLKYLKILMEAGIPMGVDALTNLLQQDKATIKEMEKLLFSLKMVEYTKQGRAIMPNGYAVLGQTGFSF